jgi:phosphotransferase system enzyme I (PtsI)
MEVKRGIAVSPGVAIGPAFVLDHEAYHISRRTIARSEVESELAGLQEALDRAVEETREHEQQVRSRLGAQHAAIFAAHSLLLMDPNLAREIQELIRDKRYSAEYALSRIIRRHAKLLESVKLPSFASRTVDLFDIEKRVLRHLLGKRREQLGHLEQKVVLLAHDLTPSETASLDPDTILAFVTEAGGRTSHTAILAGVLEIPAIVGVGKFLEDVSGGDVVIADGNDGVIVLNPDAKTLEEYEKTRTSFLSFESTLESLRELPAVTRDGVEVRLLGNIEFPHETEHCLHRGAQGVGLYRTEFLYLGRQEPPSEEDQFEAYQTVVRAMGPGRPVVIRTMDLGADKLFGTLLDGEGERNPFLGVRSIRLCLENLTLFKTQLRAILRVSYFGDVRIMFPMISTLRELRQCKLLLAEVKEDLEEEGLAFNPNMPVGTMIEVPSAAILADRFAKEVDFFSIGTNDLVQYTLAADRTSEAVASIYNPGDPAVLRLVAGVVQAAQEANIAVNVCGEMSGDVTYTMLLLGMGLRQLSVTPHAVPELKKVIRSVTLVACTQVAREALTLPTARDVNNYLREQTRRILPEVVK